MEMNIKSYWVYILFSKEYNKFYIGQTNNIVDRLYRHNSGFEKATKPYLPWELKLSIEKEDRADAMKLEKKLKNLSKSRILQFIEKYGNSDIYS
jgi:putative endonuclease